MISSDEKNESWWSGWVQSAKAKSENVLNFVKRDLSEFSLTMQNDVSYVKEKLTQENATAASEKVKQGMTNILGGLSKALIIRPPDDDLDSETIEIVDGQPVVFDRIKARLHALQIDPATYLTEPEGPFNSNYEHFISTEFNLENLKGEISDLLVLNAHVRSIYTQIVPITVSNVDFWRRYFFKKRQLDENEIRRSQIIKRVDEVQKKELDWDEDLDEQLSKNSKSRDTPAKFSPEIPLILTDEIASIDRNGINIISDVKDNLNNIENILNEPVDAIIGGDKVENVEQIDMKNFIDLGKINDIQFDKNDLQFTNEVVKCLSEDKLSFMMEIVNKDMKTLNKFESNKKIFKESLNASVELEPQTILIDSNEKALLSDSQIYTNPLLVTSNLISESLLVDIAVESSSSNSPTSWTNISNIINSKEVNSPQSSPIESDDKLDGLNDDWERDFDGTICDSVEATNSSVHMQIVSSSNTKERGDDWEEW